MARLIEDKFNEWAAECDARFRRLKANEEELNRIFLGIYGLQDELSAQVADKDVTVRRADLQREIRSLLSYAVGCMFGRYSPDTASIGPQTDVLPLAENDAGDDVVSRFVRFVETVYGEETREENLRFVAEALGAGGEARAVIRRYFLRDFCADHRKIYRKRPIYWLSDSGDLHAFRCLVYMHTLTPDTLGRIRTQYVLPLLDQADMSGEYVRELQDYAEKLRRLADCKTAIDPDAGVLNNYARFQDVLERL